jgi:hypothetical protein
MPTPARYAARIGTAVCFLSICAALLVGCSREPSAWQKAEAQNTVEAYRTYLSAYPDGAHALEAKTLRARLELPEIEGSLMVVMLDAGVERPSTYLFTIEQQGTVYQLLQDSDTQYHNIEVTERGVLWNVGKLHRVNGIVTSSKPAQFANVPEAGISTAQTPFKFIVAKEVTLVKE